MSEIKLGQLIEGAAERDAIHVAVTPVLAGENLYPAQRVTLTGGLARPGEPAVGIVDPYLSHAVPKGAMFWLCLLPGTVTGMRHHWAHPRFDDEDEHTDAEEWMRNFAKQADLTFEQVLSAGRTYLATGAYFVQRDSSAAQDAAHRLGSEFWRRYAEITGERVPEDIRDEDAPFSCSC